MTVLCVDNDSDMLCELMNAVQSARDKVSVQGFTDAKEALTYTEEKGCKVLFCEIDLHSDGSLTLAEQIRLRFPWANIIFVTDNEEKEHTIEVQRLRPSGYVIKPVTAEKVAKILNHLRYPVPERRR